MEVRDQRLVKGTLEPFHRRRLQLSARPHTYRRRTHAYLLLPGTPLIHEVLSTRTLVVGWPTIKSNNTRLLFQEVQLIVCWIFLINAVFNSGQLTVFQVSPLKWIYSTLIPKMSTK